MKILALEFSSPQRSAAVLNAASINEVVESGSRGANALEMIETALGEAKLEREQIECIAVGIGPGSYTGIRAAISLAQGWQLARRVKLLGISSAACLAVQARPENIFGRVNVIIDAQRGEFYLATFEITADGAREIEPLRLASLAEIREREKAGEVLIGPEVMNWIPAGKIIFPRAAMLATLASGRTDFVAGERLEPIYLREAKFVKAPKPRVLNDE